MAGMRYGELAERLTPEAMALFKDMVAAHLESTGNRMFIRSDSWGGTRLAFTGDSSRVFNNIDAGALEDVLSYDLLHVDFSARGTPNYRVSGEAQLFYSWLMQQQGSPIAQVEREVVRLVDSTAFADAHPGGAHHLREAFTLLFSGQTGAQAVSEIGDHLRKALMDVTSDVVGPEAGGAQEQPIKRLEEHIAALNLQRREVAVVVQVIELSRVALRLDHRLNHIRDEADQGEPTATWDEIRRAAFATSLACYELDRLRRR